MEKNKLMEELVRKAVANGAGRYGLCDYCDHQVENVCEFRPWRELDNVTRIVSCPELKCKERKIAIISGRGAGKSFLTMLEGEEDDN